MITDAFDDKSPAKINVKRNENAIPVDAVIFTFSQEIEKYVVASYDCEKVGEFLMACGSTSVYLLKYHGKRFGFYRTWVGAPACVAPIEELSTVLDTDKIIHFGGAGCLNKDIAPNLDVYTLASLFNPGLVEIPQDRQSVFTIDTFASTNGDNANVLGVLTTRRWFKFFETMRTVRPIENPQGLFTNFFLHRWMTLSLSPFETCVVLRSGDGT